jgi:coenzyme F420-0:L-glutamate ligase/coenzyme F420-1:gamma-L-glutamate ligase
MIDTLNILSERRSVRKYLPREVPNELVKRVLLAGGRAPSAHNAQPWRFIVIADPSVKRALALAMAEAWAVDLIRDGFAVEAEKRKTRIEQFEKAPVIIVACLTTEDMRKFNDVRRQNCERDLAIQSLGAALENLLLAAHALGLGACWFSAPCFCKETVRKTLNIPGSIEPEALVVMGYPAETPPKTKRNPIGMYCFLDTWGNAFG